MADSLIEWSMRTLLLALLIAGKPWEFPAHGQFLFEEAEAPTTRSSHPGATRLPAPRHSHPRALRHERASELHSFLRLRTRTPRF